MRKIHQVGIGFIETTRRIRKRVYVERRPAPAPCLFLDSFIYQCSPR